MKTTSATPEAYFADQVAEAKYTAPAQVDETNVRRWLHKAVEIQWDYPNLRANDGVLKRRT